MSKYFVLIECDSYDYNYKSQHPDWRRDYCTICQLSNRKSEWEPAITEAVKKCSFYTPYGNRRLEAAFLINTDSNVEETMMRNGWWRFGGAPKYEDVNSIIKEWFPGAVFVNLTEVYDVAAGTVGYRPSSIELEREYSLVVRLTTVLASVGLVHKRSMAVDRGVSDLIFTTISNIRHGDGGLDFYLKNTLRMEVQSDMDCENENPTFHVGVVGEGKTVHSLIGDLIKSASIG